MSINHHNDLKTAHTLPRPPHHLHPICHRRSFYIASSLLNQTSALLPQAEESTTDPMGAKYRHVLRCQSVEQFRLWI